MDDSALAEGDEKRERERERERRPTFPLLRSPFTRSRDGKILTGFDQNLLRLRARARTSHVSPMRSVDCVRLKFRKYNSSVTGGDPRECGN